MIHFKCMSLISNFERQELRNFRVQYLLSFFRKYSGTNWRSFICFHFCYFNKFSRTPICLGDWGRRTMNTTNFPQNARRENYWSINFDIEPKDERWKERPTVVTIHGWRGYVNFRKGFLALGQGFQKIGNQFGKHHNVNLVRADWKNGFYYGYNAAVLALKAIGKSIATYLNEKLGHDEVAWRNLTVIGFSLGTHISGRKLNNNMKIYKSTYLSGYVGRATNSRVGTIIGLDGASIYLNFCFLKNHFSYTFFQEPQFEGENIKADMLTKADAEYVECLHTSTDCYGVEHPYCHADFYPTYGYAQPGCMHLLGK